MKLLYLARRGRGYGNSSLAGDPAGVDGVGGAGDGSGGVGGEELGEGGYLVRIDQALDGGGFEHDLLDNVIDGDAARLRLVFNLLLYESRTHVAGADGVDGDAELADFEGNRLGEADEAVLGRVIGGLVRAGDEAVNRGDV